MTKFTQLTEGLKNDPVARIKATALNGVILDAVRRIEQMSNAIAAEMASIYGGEWQAQVDYRAELVIVRRHLHGSRS